MKFTSSLRFDGNDVQLAASRSLALFGRVVIVFLGLQLAYAWDLARHSPIPAPMLALKLFGVVGMLLVMGWCAHQVYIRPWVIQQRTQLSRAAK